MMKKEWGRAALALVLCATMIASGCSTNWIGEGEQIIAALIPAVTNIVALISELEGRGVSTADAQTIQNAGMQASADLALIDSLLTAYQKADAAEQPGILNQIAAAITAVENNLQGLLGSLHINDAATQAKVTAVVGIVLSEVQSLAAILPVIQGSGIGSQRSVHTYSSIGLGGNAQKTQAVRSRGLLTASEFVTSYNATLTARTGNAALDHAAEGLRIHLHHRIERYVTAGVLK